MSSKGVMWYARVRCPIINLGGHAPPTRPTHPTHPAPIPHHSPHLRSRPHPPTPTSTSPHATQPRVPPHPLHATLTAPPYRPPPLATPPPFFLRGSVNVGSGNARRPSRRLLPWTSWCQRLAVVAALRCLPASAMCCLSGPEASSCSFRLGLRAVLLHRVGRRANGTGGGGGG